MPKLNACALNSYDKMKPEVTNYVSLQVPSISVGMDVDHMHDSWEYGEGMGRRRRGDRVRQRAWQGAEKEGKRKRQVEREGRERNQTGQQTRSQRRLQGF